MHSRIGLGLILVAAACSETRPVIDLGALHFDTLFTVGMENGPEEVTFGNLRDVEPGPDDSFFVLDGQAGTISWFDKQGQFLQALRSHGQGPGELATPVDFVFARDRLYVLDSGNARVSEFLVDGGQIKYLADHRLPIGGTRLCVLRGHLLLHQAANGTLLHELGGDGRITRSFATIPKLPDDVGPFLSAVHAQKVIGPIFCDEDGGRVVLMARSMPEIRAFSSAGDSLWTSELAGFAPVMFTVSEQRALTPLPPPPDGWRVARSIAPLASQGLLLQYEIWRAGARPEGRDFEALESRLLDDRTGAEVGRTQALPLIVAVRGQRVYSYANQPFPRVAVLRRR